MNKKVKFFFYYALPVIAFGSSILYFSGESSIRILTFRVTQTRFLTDKVYHFIEYVFFSTIVSRFFKKTKIKANYVFAVLLFISVFSFIDETTQFFTPGRTFSLPDILSNLFGCVVSLLLKTEKLLK